jgi:hypothetical protein
MKFVRWRDSLLSVLLLGLSFGSLHAQVSVTTYHNDVARTGQNTSETLLTPASVGSSYFGKLYTVALDGYAFAQPLYVPNVSIAGGTHNVLYVATGHDSVYAIDADAGTVLEQVSLIPAGGRTLDPATDINAICTDQVPEVGITGTPVIDPSTGTLYVVAKSLVGSQAYLYLHALDIGSLTEKFGGPASITGSVPGNGESSSNGVVPFNVLQQNQRAALLLVNGHLIISFGSHCDLDPWHGWIFSYGAATLAQEALFNTTPNGSNAGVWMSGGGPAADASGNIYFSTGNGTWDGVTDYGDSIMKLGPPSAGTFPVLDYFTPWDQLTLEQGDSDVAAGGALLLPTLPSGKQLLALVAKTGTLFEVDQNNMGKYCPNLAQACTNSDTQIFAEIPGATRGTWGTPAYWNGNLYLSGSNGELGAFSFNTTTGAISTAPTSQSSAVFGFPAPTPSVSANGTTNGILWVLDDSEYTSTNCTGASTCQGLYAYNANNLNDLLYSSNQAPNNRDVPGPAVKLAIPTIANGKVYVGSQYAVSAYGQIATPPPAGNSVSLASFANVEAIGVLGTATTNGGLDGHGQTYAANLLGNQLPWAGSNFTLGTPGVLDAAANTTITLPAGNYTSLSLLATGVNSNQTNQTFSVTYTDGSKTAFVQSVSDWSTPQHYSGESIVTTTPYRITASGGEQLGSYSIYGYMFALNAAKTVASLTLPTNKNVAVFALDLTPAQGTTPAAATPTFSPAPGTYSGTQSVTLSDATTGASIYYTTDGSTPTTASTLYTAPIGVAATTTINAIAVAPGYAASAVASGSYTITAQPVAATPTFSPAPGIYAGAQSVALSDTTTGAVIYYTLDGTTPSVNSPQYVSPLNVGATTTIEAIAVASGYAASAVASGTYTISALPVSVSLAGVANLYGLANSGTAVTGGGADGHNQAYAANLLGTTVTWSGGTFTLAAAGPGSAVTSKTIPLPAGNDTAISLLGTGVNGAQVNQAFIVTYTDGSTQSFTQSLSDWFTPAQYTGETIAATTAYRVKSTGITQTGPYYLYAYSFALNSAKTVQSIALPTNANVVIVAIDVTAAAGGAAAATPTFSPAPGTYVGTQSVTLSDATTGASIYYTTNGSTPTTASTLYTAPIGVAAATTINAIAVATGYTASAVASGSYTITAQPVAASPTFSPAPGTYVGTQSVTLSDATTGASIYYTTDGSTPTTASTLYTAPIGVAATTTINAIAVAPGYAASAVASGSYTITAQPVAASPTFSPAPGIYAGAQSVALSDTTTGAVIYYTLDGTTPSVNSPQYVSPLNVGATTTIEAIAVASGYAASAVASGTYTISALPVSVSLAGVANLYGLANSGTAVTGGGADGHNQAYAANLLGTTVTWSGGTFTLAAAGPGSAVTSKTIPLPAGNDTAISLLGTGVNGAQVNQAFIVTYTDGSTQSFTQSLSDWFTPAQYTGETIAATTAYRVKSTGITQTGPYYLYAYSFALNSAKTVQSIALPTNANVVIVAIDVTAAAGGAAAATPTFSPAPGTYVGTQSVTLSDATTGASIYYTTNGSTPTTASTLYTAPIGVAAATTINAIAVATGYTASAVASGSYTITAQPVAASPTFSPAPGTYVGTQSVTLSDATTGASIYYTTDGSTPTTASTLYTAPIGVAATTTINAIAVAPGYAASAVASGSYTITAQPVAASPTFSPAPGTYAGSQSVTLSDATTGASIYYTTNGSTPTTASTLYAAPIGVAATTTINAIAVATGYTASAVASGTYTITAPPIAATPTFNPAPGTYAGSQNVTLSDATTGASIYYTTNGSTPTTASTLYTAAITVAANTTIKAIAVATGYTASPVATGAYSIKALPVAATPTFNPAPGTYVGPQSVTLSDATTGASIYYTTNGSTPTTASTLYTAPIAVAATTTIKAIAVANGYRTSGVARGRYTIR